MLGRAVFFGVSVSLVLLVGQGSASADGWLHVVGPRIVDEKGAPVRLVGIGLSPIHSEWRQGGFGGLEEIVTYYKRQGFNTIRVAFARSDTYDNHQDLVAKLGVERFIDEQIAPQVTAATAGGMYAVLDWHQFFHDEAMPGVDVGERVRYLNETSIALWTALARRYKDDPRVAMYELWNEPNWPGYRHGDPKQIPILREWYRRAIAAIRKIDRRHMIMISDYNAGWGASNALVNMWIPDGKLLAVDTLVPPQIVYSHHTSAMNELKGENATIEEAVAKYQVPVVYGEVEIQPDIDANKYLPRATQRTYFERLIRRITTNAVMPSWFAWRSGINDWQDVWRPPTRTK